MNTRIYCVSVPEVWYQDYYVVAESSEEAKHKVDQYGTDSKDVIIDESNFNYSETLSQNKWNVRCEPLSIGDVVLVKPDPDDIFSQTFQGTIIDFRDPNLLVIVDGDGECFDVYHYQVNLTSENLDDYV